MHFSHPYLGTYEVVQFFDSGYLKGTHSGEWYTAPYPFHGILGWKPHTMSFSFQYNATSYHTIAMIEAFYIPGQAISSYQRWCLGSFLQNMKIISAGGNTCSLDSIFGGQVLYFWCPTDSCRNASIPPDSTGFHWIVHFSHPLLTDY